MNKEQLIALGLTDEQADKVVDGFGQMVPKSRLDTKIQEVTDLKQQIADRDTQLNNLKSAAGDNEVLKQQIATLQQENETVKSDFESKLQQRDYDYSIESALREMKAKNPKAVKALLDLEKIKLVDGQLVGLEEQIKTLKTSDDYLFASDKLKGNTPPGGSTGITPTDKNPFSKEHYNLTEQAKLFKENPELYNQLKTQATK